MTLEIFLDLDGVVADLHTGMHKAWSTYGLTSPPPLPDLSHRAEPDAAFEGWYHDDRRWREGPVTRAEFWEGLPAYDHAGDLHALLRAFGKVRVLSSPGRPEFAGAAAAGKFAWCMKHLGLMPEDVLLVGSREKHLLSGPGRVLVDDSPPNIRRWVGRAYLWPHALNRRYRTGPAGKPLDDLREFMVRTAEAHRATGMTPYAAAAVGSTASTEDAR